MAESWFTLSRQDQAEALEVAAGRSGRPAHLLEKDIWVVWALSAIYGSPIADTLTFKGGTSLSKVFRVIDRFSEDIDLTYDIRALVPDLLREGNPLRWQAQSISTGLPPIGNWLIRSPRTNRCSLSRRMQAAPGSTISRRRAARFDWFQKMHRAPPWRWITKRCERMACWLWINPSLMPSWKAAQRFRTKSIAWHEGVGLTPPNQLPLLLPQQRHP